MGRPPDFNPHIGEAQLWNLTNNDQAPARTFRLGAFITSLAISPDGQFWQGNWNQLKGKMREKWGKLTDDDWDTVAGKKDQFLGKLQERYGYSREQAERDYDEWERAHGTHSKVA